MNIPRTSFTLLMAVATVSCGAANFTATAPSNLKSRVSLDTSSSSSSSPNQSESKTLSNPGNAPKKPSTAPSQAVPQHLVVSKTGPGGSRIASFLYGPKSTPNDVLFVFDNSASMKGHLDLVKAGFEKLADAQWFGDPKIAVMTTMPGKFDDLSVPHPGVKRYTGIQFEPGFLSFVSSAGLAQYAKANPGNTRLHYREPLCDGEWFSPSAKNSNGKRCLSVALQNPHHGVDCEAGMTALSQILDKKGQIFRQGAFAQVVFVSDAQDPGCHNAALKNSRPSAEALLAKLKSKNQIIGLKVHGVLPIEGDKPTSETAAGTFGFPYNAVVKSSGGLLENIRQSNDYSTFATSIANTYAEAVFTLPERASSILNVSVAGKVLKAGEYSLVDNSTRLQILGLKPAANVEININYMP